MITAYYRLAKPGIIYGNLIAALAGFFLASDHHISVSLLLAMSLGLALVIGAGCVFNNILDRGIDKNMARTKHRALVTGEISTRSAIAYGSVLLLAGIVVLYAYTTIPALLAAAVGFIVYVLLYTPLKHRSPHATLVGSIAGAVPPVVGYCAVTNQFDTASLLLFVILTVWQMPHFYAIAVYRQPEYAAAQVPILSVTSPLRTVKYHILFYITAFLLITPLLTIFHITGITYAAIAGGLALYWLWMALQGLKSSTDNTRWGKQIFGFSLIILLVLSVTLSLNSFLP